MSASTAAVVNRRLRNLVAEPMTVSSNPKRAEGPTLSGSPAACSSAGWTADQTVCHPTPILRASDATDAPTAAKAPTAASTALLVSTRRGPASPDSSVHVLAPHPPSGHAQTRLFHRTPTGIPPAAAASRKTTLRRPLDRARLPHAPQRTTRPPGDSTSTTNSPASTRSATTANPNAPKPETEPA
ncbi:hypothetical protein [Candidatus Poriferisocius sp.]|uniref:hypothetical protein n=1 Tax=Candidatus Poriferisocius sp. TaxID=3101276 RepID=UPI003B018AB0